VSTGPKARIVAGIFKYAAELQRLQNCPQGCVPASGVVYRLVHDPFDKYYDFSPSALWKPEYVDKCAGWGLSLYTTEAAARKRRESIRKAARKYPHISKEIGDCIARATLVPTHGQMTLPNSEKHFTLFEFVGTDLSSAFKIVVRSDQ